MKDKRDIILEFAPNPDAVLNALHQGGWQVIPKPLSGGDSAGRPERAIAAQDDQIGSPLLNALLALTIMSGNQICFRTVGNIPMQMSRKQERIVSAAIDEAMKK
jgi:hypothetical protein